MQPDDAHPDVQTLSEAQGAINSIDQEQYPPNVREALDRAGEAVEDAAIEVQLYHNEE